MRAPHAGGADLRGVLARSVAVLVLLPACSPEVSATASTSEDTSAAADSEATGDLPPTDGSCRQDSDCGGDLSCNGDTCRGCTADHECLGGRRCRYYECVPLDELPVCAQLVEPTCGDGVIAASEECEGGSDCIECRVAGGPEPWIASDEQLNRLVPIADGGALALQRNEQVLRYDNFGELASTLSLAHYGSDIAIDPSGNLYVAGANAIAGGEASAPWLESWTPAGAPRWSVPGTSYGAYRVVAADATRVVAGGETEQENSPWNRGLVAMYDPEGTLRWSLKLVALQSAFSMVLVDADVAVVGTGSYPGAPTQLVRLDEAGEIRWTVDLSALDTAFIHVDGLAHDGRGGTWSFGRLDAGPWAVRHDADGEEIERLDCFGGTEGDLVAIAVDPGGRAALAVQDTRPHLPVPWIAIVENGSITRALTIDGEERSEVFGLAWRSDGALAIGWVDIAPSEYTYRGSSFRP